MNLGRESEKIEFKESTNELSDALNDICAILNKNSEGILYFGVKNNGDIVGQQIGESTLRDISRRIYERIEPKIYPSISIEKIEGKEIIKVLFKGVYRPYACRGVHYIRVSDESRIMTEQELVNFIRNINYSNVWETQLTSYTIEDIDDDALNDFYLRATKSGRLDFPIFNKINLLRYLGLMEENKLNNAGYYLFGKNTKLNLKLSILATNDKLTFIDLKQQTNNIYKLVDYALSYVLQNIHWKAEITSRSRIDIPEIPDKAIREIVINSFAHAQYESNTEHEINIYPNRIEIYNPGTFPERLTPIDFVNTTRRSIIRNKLILDVLFRSKDVEKGGSGFKRVYSLCNENSVNCDYILDDYGFSFVFYRKEKYISEGNNRQDKNLKMNKTEQDVLELIKINPYIKKMEIADKLNKSDRTIQRAIIALQKYKCIEREGNYKTGFWRILD